tara:strand:- start:1552 stop:1773 length:222 start_codon:yes stop_codon:yes gene_type:complete
MTREEIVRLAESAGITVIGEAVWRLCELVAAAEREACAQMVEAGLLSEVTLGIYGDKSLAKDVAADIRARGQE